MLTAQEARSITVSDVAIAGMLYLVEAKIKEAVNNRELHCEYNFNKSVYTQEEVCTLVNRLRTCGYKACIMRCEGDYYVVSVVW